MKFCAKCCNELEYTDFYKDIYSEDGLKSICISCDKANSKSYYQKRKEKMSKAEKERRRQSYLKWKAANKDRYIELYNKHNCK